MNRRLAGLALAAMLLLGCDKPRPPAVTVVSTDLVARSADALVIRVKLSLRNPNDYSLSAQRVTAALTMMGKPVTQARVDHQLTLPPRVDVPLETDLVVPRPVVDELRSKAATLHAVPYHVGGEVEVGTGLVSMTVAFQKDGSVPRETLAARLRGVR